MKYIYWISTGLLTLLMLFSASMYVFNHDAVAPMFTSLGYPAYLIYPLAGLKVLGLVAIWSRVSETLLQWAYFGFLLDFTLAFSAHIAVADGAFGMAAGAIVLWVASYFSWRELHG